MLQAQKKISRKELKKDPFFEEIDRIIRIYQEKQQAIWIILAVVIVLIASIWGFMALRNSKLDDASAAFGIAEQYYANRDYDSAKSKFNEVINLYGSTEYAGKADFYLGMIALNAFDYETAKSIFTKYLDEYASDSENTATALSGLATIAVHDEDYKNAASYYQKAADQSKYRFNQIEYLEKSVRENVRAGDLETAAASLKKLAALPALTDSEKEKKNALEALIEMNK